MRPEPSKTAYRKRLARLLADPQFLYRIESEHPELADGAIYRISDIELASRLSFFLWSSIPDETLLDLAAKGQLSRPEILEQQVRRMLADPRSNQLVTNFAGQWLRLRELHGSQPADPEFDDNLRDALSRKRSCCSAASCTRTAASSTCSTRTTPI